MANPIDESNVSKDLRIRIERNIDIAAENGEKLVRKGHELSASGQWLVDWARVTRMVMPCIQDETTLVSIDRSFAQSSQMASSFINAMFDVNSSSLTSTTDASAIFCAIDISTIEIRADVNDPRRPLAEEAIRQAKNLAMKPELTNRIKLSFQRLQLDLSHSGRLSAVDHLETAMREFSVNAASLGQASTWLIPMRECIQTVLDSLLKRRRTQSKVKSAADKVAAILAEFGRADLPPHHFRQVSNECGQILHEKLSKSKQTSISREHSENFLLAAVLWLDTFLSAIDENKLRSGAR
jgi:hypothetical protein